MLSWACEPGAHGSHRPGHTPAHVTIMQLLTDLQDAQANITTCRPRPRQKTDSPTDLRRRPLPDPPRPRASRAAPTARRIVMAVHSPECSHGRRSQRHGCGPRTAQLGQSASRTDDSTAFLGSPLSDLGGCLVFRATAVLHRLPWNLASHMRYSGISMHVVGLSCRANVDAGMNLQEHKEPTSFSNSQPTVHPPSSQPEIPARRPSPSPSKALSLRSPKKILLLRLLLRLLLLVLLLLLLLLTSILTIGKSDDSLGHESVAGVAPRRSWPRCH